jgi:3-oxoacyl-[acyl-carrier protein] reductase
VDLGLTDRVALVTGATRGIGRAIAEALADEGARVAVASRSAATTGAGAGLRSGTRGYAFDSTDLDAIDPLVDAVERELGPIEIYVANTGGPPKFADPLAPAAEDWAAAHRELVISPMLLMRRLVPGMCERGFGRVVAVSSFVAREPTGGLQLSNVNRPGLLAGMKLLARDHAAAGVTFNAVLPGRIATDRIASSYGGLDAAQEAARDEVPARRLGTPREVADAAVFLCSARASYVTGQSLLVDGGLTQSW